MVATASIFGFPCTGAGTVISVTASLDHNTRRRVVSDVCSLVMLLHASRWRCGSADQIRPPTGPATTDSA